MAKTHCFSCRSCFLSVVALFLLITGQTSICPPVTVHAEALNSLSDLEPYIEAEYIVHIDQSRQTLFIAATFNHLRTDEIYIGFEDYLVYGGSHLTSRISQVKVKTVGVAISAVDTGIYRIETGGRESITLTYQLDPNALPHDHHLTALTPTILHLPGIDFFIRVEEQAPPSHDDDGNPEMNMDFNLIKSYQVTIENLPPDWEFLSTYTQLSANSVLIDDRPGEEVLLSAGRYKKVGIDSGDAHITVAFDRGLDLDVEQYAGNFEDVLHYYYEIYQDIPETNILMTVHRHPKEFSGLSWSLGGQVKKQNIINSLGWSPLLSPDVIKAQILSHLAHEGHHIWFMYPFNLDEGVYWWSEGVTEYISQKALYELDLISEEEFQQDLIRKFIKYDGLSIKNHVNLVKATRVSDPNEEETSLQYDKGALVAYLLDQRLQARGQNIEMLLTDFYQTYALTQKPIDNQELINYIDSYLGESSFTEEYVLGTEQLPLSEFDFGWRYHWEIVERYLPPIPFPYNVLVPLVTILVILVAVRLLYKIILVRVPFRKAKQPIE